MAGIFAAGDVRHGSVKRVASAVGEGGISIRSVHQHLAHLHENDKQPMTVRASGDPQKFPLEGCRIRGESFVVGVKTHDDREAGRDLS